MPLYLLFNSKENLIFARINDLKAERYVVRDFFGIVFFIGSSSSFVLFVDEEEGKNSVGFEN
jgi:hypothetical protein